MGIKRLVSGFREKARRRTAKMIAAWALFFVIRRAIVMVFTEAGRKSSPRKSVWPVSEMPMKVPTMAPIVPMYGPKKIP